MTLSSRLLAQIEREPKVELVECSVTARNTHNIDEEAVYEEEMIAKFNYDRLKKLALLSLEFAASIEKYQNAGHFVHHLAKEEMFKTLTKAEALIEELEKNV